MRKIVFVILFFLVGLTLFPGSGSAQSPTPSPRSGETAPGDVLSVTSESLPGEEPLETIADPLEPVNRFFFQVNDKLYFWGLKPVARGYKAVIPEKARVSVRNFFSNLIFPVRMVNCLFQGKFCGAGQETARFFLNTTIGLAGLFDPAKSRFCLERQEEDFGQTLGFWGMGPAFYINWPLLGPSNVRDTIGWVGDLFLDPRTYLIGDFWVDAGVSGYERVNETSLTLGEYESLKEGALDPYVALRKAYSQYRQHKIADD